MGISVFTTDNMRLYAPGRYHSIAEIMLNAREVRILDEEDGSDAEAAGDGDDGSADGTADADGSDTELSGSTDVASSAPLCGEYNVAYLAWDTVPALPSALRDCRGLLRAAARGAAPAIYLVADVLSDSDPRAPAAEFVGALARAVARDPSLRRNLLGVAVGTTGGEDGWTTTGLTPTGLDGAVVPAFCVGAAERRRCAAVRLDRRAREVAYDEDLVAPEARSSVGMVCRSRWELEGRPIPPCPPDVDHDDHPDPAHGRKVRVRAITTGSWEGKGDVRNFAARAHLAWRRHREGDGGEAADPEEADREFAHFDDGTPFGVARGRHRSRRRGGGGGLVISPKINEGIVAAEFGSNIMVFVFLAFAFVYMMYDKDPTLFGL